MGQQYRCYVSKFQRNSSRNKKKYSGCHKIDQFPPRSSMNMKYLSCQHNLYSSAPRFLFFILYLALPLGVLLLHLLASYGLLRGRGGTKSALVVDCISTITSPPLFTDWEDVHRAASGAKSTAEARSEATRLFLKFLLLTAAENLLLVSAPLIAVWACEQKHWNWTDLDGREWTGNQPPEAGCCPLMHGEAKQHPLSSPGQCSGLRPRQPPSPCRPGLIRLVAPDRPASDAVRPGGGLPQVWAPMEQAS